MPSLPERDYDGLASIRNQPLVGNALTRPHVVSLDDTGWPVPAIHAIRGGQVHVSLASHNPIAHILGETCIHLNGYSSHDKTRLRKQGYGHVYPLVHERNLGSVLIHESLHCVLQDLGFDRDGLDGIIGVIDKSRRIIS